MKFWTKGHSAGAFAFFIWGLFPIFWKFFSKLDALTLSVWRFLFTALTLAFIVSYKKQWRSLLTAIFHSKMLKKLVKNTRKNIIIKCTNIDKKK